MVGIEFDNPQVSIIWKASASFDWVNKRTTERKPGTGTRMSQFDGNFSFNALPQPFIVTGISPASETKMLLSLLKQVATTDGKVALDGVAGELTAMETASMPSSGDNGTDWDPFPRTP